MKRELLIGRAEDVHGTLVGIVDVHRDKNICRRP